MDQSLFECWRPAERKIFRYWDGGRQRAVDPLALEEELNRVGGADWPNHLSTLRASAKISQAIPSLAENVARDLAERTEAALRAVVSLVRQVFAIAPYQNPSGSADHGRRNLLARWWLRFFGESPPPCQGLTNLECVELLIRYLQFQAALVEETRPLPPSPSATGPRPSADDPATPSSAASSGTPAATVSAPSTDRPGPS